MAIFILVVLAAGLGATLVTISAGQQRASAFDAQGIRAYQAARAGIEFGIGRAMSGTCAAGSVTLTNSLAGFRADVTCTSSTHTEGTTTVTMYEITATACNRNPCPNTADATYVERQLRVLVGSSEP